MSDRARYWQQLVSAWEKSGLSQAEFCRRRRIKAVTFGWWKRKLRGPRKKRGRRVNHARSKAVVVKRKGQSRLRRRMLMAIAAVAAMGTAGWVRARGAA